MGADSFVVAEQGEDIVAAVNNALGGMPDIVFEAAGVPGTLAQAINHVRPRGTVVVLGCCTQPDNLVPAAGLFKEVRVQFSMIYDISDYEYVARTLDSGAIELRSMVTQTVSFDDFPAAFEALKHRSPQCKLMLDPTI
jgi:(R,R)-butanediol dehydrogenase/meso-butanediol dehydrogenase/diacetyl reductase